MHSNFEEYFEEATGFIAYPYQRRLAEGKDLPSLVHVPTGVGKTEASILAWLWRRHHHEDNNVRKKTPRRLIYCLPMRVLVEQTKRRAEIILKNLGLHEEVGLYILMGGEDKTNWTAHPEAEAILIGTQDMLLSRAMNRGYGASRFRWPVEFGLLNNDCLWVFDEVQLMDAGLATSAQLAAFRGHLGIYGHCLTVWMSATLDPLWLRTVDFSPQSHPFRLGSDDNAYEDLSRRLSARKILSRGGIDVGEGREEVYSSRVAEDILDRHVPASLTLAIVNTVKRAQLVYDALRRGCKALKDNAPDLRLIHSRFRPKERERWVSFLGREAKLPESGRIIVSTQVVEAGVDISARTLIAELAPWPSLVQRFGRCNRFGEHATASVIWYEVGERKSAPYLQADLVISRERLKELESKCISPSVLDEFPMGLPYEPKLTLRKRDLVDLFDTTPDLMGNDIDVSRFIRDVEDLDVLVFWRDLSGRPPGDDLSGRAERQELCPVPSGEVRAFINELRSRRSSNRAWIWDELDGRWRELLPREVQPGQRILLDAVTGGYSRKTGWDPKSKKMVTPVGPLSEGQKDATGFDPLTRQNYWQILESHLERTEDKTRELLEAFESLDMPHEVVQAVVLAARLHDVGKAHPVFQHTVLTRLSEEERRRRSSAVWAKSGDPFPHHKRPYFRHELAGSLAVLKQPDVLNDLPADLHDLVVFLIAAHHGKVRLSIRSVPGEHDPGDGRRYARGVWDGDILPAMKLASLHLRETTLDLSPMELGLDPLGNPSWTERMLALRDSPDLGPFRLAFLEALSRVADWSASKNPGSEGVDYG